MRIQLAQYGQREVTRQALQVLRTVLNTEQSHSLLVLIYHVADRILADKTRSVHLGILANWTREKAHLFPKEHLDAFINTIQSRPVEAKMHQLVATDAVLWIRDSLSSSALPFVGDPELQLGYFIQARNQLCERARRLRWYVWKPLPALVGPLLTNIATAGVRHAALFITNNEGMRPPY
ncbi:hypothetical protein PG999_007821 [Apiospora kogelbergensis]|uniref:Uncharacterized protein n=1 Tax=Apiospora kogelbergensis TaxID=1337665 RepID=A0AAW0QND9_9PEZI